MRDPLAYLDGQEAQMVKGLKELVRIPTVNPPGVCYEDMTTLIGERCRSLGMAVDLHRVPDRPVLDSGEDPQHPRLNVIARLEVGAPSTVHFNAHYDVVPAAGNWQHGGPFDPQLHRGWLYGRGSGDMKGSIEALLSAIRAVRACGGEPAFNVECSFTADEETGGALGAGWIVAEGLVNADYAIVCEGAAGTRIGCGHNGVLWLEGDVQGKSAHASNPDLGCNAFEGMAELVYRLQTLKRTLRAPGRKYRDSSGGDRQPTINMGGVFGGAGQKVNTVPGNATFTIDRRIPPNEQLADAESALRASIERAAFRGASGVRYKARSELRIDPCVIDVESELPRAFAASVRAVRRRATSYRVTTGFTDLHYFVHEGGLPGIGYGVDGRQGHAVDERLKARDLVQTAKVYTHFILNGIS